MKPYRHGAVPGDSVCVLFHHGEATPPSEWLAGQSDQRVAGVIRECRQRHKRVDQIPLNAVCKKWKIISSEKGENDE